MYVVLEPIFGFRIYITTITLWLFPWFSYALCVCVYTLISSIQVTLNGPMGTEPIVQVVVHKLMQLLHYLQYFRDPSQTLLLTLRPCILCPIVPQLVSYCCCNEFPQT